MKTTKNNPLGIGEVRNPFKYKFADEDQQKSIERFAKLGNNAAKLEALRKSLKSC